MEFLTTHQAAEALGVTDARIRQIAGHDELPGAYKWNSDWVIPRSAVEIYRASRKPAHRPKSPVPQSA